MFQVDFEDIKKLRKETCVSITECKKALEESMGDFVKARRILKEKGLADAKLRSNRDTSEGSIFALVNQNGAAILEFGCETDFVAKTDQFKSLCQKVTETFIEKKVSELTEDLISPLKNAISVFKENIILKRFKVFAPLSTEIIISSYIHNEGKIGVLIKASIVDINADKLNAVQSFLYDCAIHCAAMAPLYLKESDIPSDYLCDQRALFNTRVNSDKKTSEKPENIRQKIVEGMLSKYVNEVCLLKQNFVKEPSMTIQEKLMSVEKENNCKIEINDFVYYKVGEEGVV